MSQSNVSSQEQLSQFKQSEIQILGGPGHWLYVNGASERSSTNSLRALLGAVDKDIAQEDKAEWASLVNWSNHSNSLPIQRWFRYREAYSPHLLDVLPFGSSILDPFCGCGSILIGAAQKGKSSVGIDMNPLAVFVAKVKLSPLSASQITKASTYLEDFEKSIKNVRCWPLPALKIAPKVFEPAILDTVLRLRASIEEYAESDDQLRDFLILAWLAILEDVGSYFKEGNGIKYRNKKRTKSGYVTRPEGAWQAQRFGDDQPAFVCRMFQRQLSMMLQDTIYWQKGDWLGQEVIEGSALELKTLVPEREFDTIVFSPPYANRFDYFEAMKVELWFGGFVKTYEDLLALRKKSLRSHLGADLDRPVFDMPIVEALIGLMDRNSSSWRMGVPDALRGYFADMYQVLYQCRRVLNGGKCYVVVGNSAFAGVIFPTDSLVARLGLEAGFSSAQLQVVRHLTVAPQQRSVLNGLEPFMRESIVVLE